MFAAPPPIVVRDVALRWTSASGCIGDRELADAVTARLGRADHPGRASIVIDGSIAPSETGWTASIRTSDEHGAVLGQRDLHEPAANCREIDDKLVLVLALIIDPELFEEPAQTPTPPTPPPRRARPVVTARAPWRFGASVVGLVAAGMLPGVAVGTGLAATIEPSNAWPIEIAAILWPYDRAIAAPGGVKMLELTGGVAICPHLVGTLSACVGAQAGEVRARGYGYDRNQLQHELVADGTLMLRLERRFAPGLGARLDAGVWVPISRPKFVTRAGTTDMVVYQPAPAAFVSAIALWTQF